MKYPVSKGIGNQGGFALVTALIVMILLVFLGMFALTTTTVELRIAANDRFAKEEFFNQESCVANARLNPATWMTLAFIGARETAAFFPPPGTDGNGNGINDQAECVDPVTGAITGTYKVRKFDMLATPIAPWEDIAAFAANPAQHPANRGLPAMAHIDKPPPVTPTTMSGATSQDQFEARRFAIISYSPNRANGTVIQEGAFQNFHAQ